MTLGEFKKQTAGMPDNVVLLTPSQDHGYRLATFDLTHADHHPKLRYYVEDHGARHREPGAVSVQALVIS